MVTIRRWFENRNLVHLGTFALLASLVVFHALNNWRWLTANVTLLGWDVPSHLGTSLIYDEILRPLNLKTLFEAITWHPNRPPLFFLSAVPLYRMFGVSTDVGTMANVLYLGVLIFSVYGIGLRLGGRRVGLLAAFVVATFPMIYSISRYFYQELALAAVVALGIYVLLSTNRFEHKAASLWFGLCFGLGLLTRRTYLTFIFAPLVLVVLRSNAWPSLRQRWRGGLRLDLKDALLALAIGLALAALWVLPSRELVGHLLLDGWLLPLWAILIAGTIYLVRREAGPDTNLLAALFLGGTLGSLWLLPRLTFIERLLSFGFGIDDPRERSAGLGELSTYFYFLDKLVKEHLSLVTFAFLVVAALGLLLALWRKGNLWATLRQLDDVWWVMVLWAAVPYIVLTVSIYRKSRGITAALPALALLLAAGLFMLPWRRLVAVLVALLVAWGLLQFFVLSYQGPHQLAEWTTFTLPTLGETGLFASGGTNQLPTSGDNDPGYWVVPDILQTAEAGRQARGDELVSLGVLVNNDHVNTALLGLEAFGRYPGINIQNLAKTGVEGSVYPQLFDQDYLVLIEGDYMLIDAAAEAALDHLAAAPALFEAAFDLERRFPLPNGEALLLYRKAWPQEAEYDPAYYRTAAEAIGAWSQEGDAILLVPPEQVAALGHTYGGTLTPYLLPQTQPLDREATGRALAEIVASHPILFVLFRGEQTVDPERFVENWLNEYTYRARGEWYGDVRLVVYGSPAGNAELEHRLDAQIGDQIRLLGYSVADETVQPGAMVLLDLFWQAEEPPMEQYKVFVHLLNENGQLVAQQDGEPVGGLRPTPSWSAAEVIHDRVGVLLPADLPAGEYPLVVGMYQPDTGDRLPVTIDVGSGPVVGDSISLSMIQVH